MPNEITVTLISIFTSIITACSLLGTIYWSVCLYVDANSTLTGYRLNKNEVIGVVKNVTRVYCVHALMWWIFLPLISWSKNEVIFSLLLDENFASIFFRIYAITLIVPAALALYTLITLHLHDKKNKKINVVKADPIDEFLKDVIKVCDKHKLIIIPKNRSDLAVLPYKGPGDVFAQYVLHAVDNTNAYEDRKKRLESWHKNA